MKIGRLIDQRSALIDSFADAPRILLLWDIVMEFRMHIWPIQSLAVANRRTVIVLPFPNFSGTYSPTRRDESMVGVVIRTKNLGCGSRYLVCHASCGRYSISLLVLR